MWPVLFGQQSCISEGHVQKFVIMVLPRQTVVQHLEMISCACFINALSSFLVHSQPMRNDLEFSGVGETSKVITTFIDEDRKESKGFTQDLRVSVCRNYSWIPGFLDPKA